MYDGVMAVEIMLHNIISIEFYICALCLYNLYINLCSSTRVVVKVFWCVGVQTEQATVFIIWSLGNISWGNGLYWSTYSIGSAIWLCFPLVLFSLRVKLSSCLIKRFLVLSVRWTNMVAKYSDITLKILAIL